jgi:hypothetical protein
MFQRKGKARLSAGFSLFDNLDGVAVVFATVHRFARDIEPLAIAFELCYLFTSKQVAILLAERVCNNLGVISDANFCGDCFLQFSAIHVSVSFFFVVGGVDPPLLF